MKLMDEKGRFFGKLHIFDLLVLLVVLVGLIGMAMRLVKPLGGDMELHRATYVMEISDIQEFGTTAFSVGDTLYEQNIALGEITAVEVRPARTAKIMPDGSVREVEHLMYYNILLTVSTDRIREMNGYYIDTQELLNGTTHTVGNGFILCDAIVRGITIE